MSDELRRDCRRYSFFQLVQLLFRQRADAVAPGGEGPARRENIRFRPAASLGFSASDVEGVERLEAAEGEAEGRFQVTVNFMGLYGPASPLPTHFTEEILWAGAEGEGARGFLDLFNHRFISLFYRAWEKYRYPVQFEVNGADGITRRALCLMGLGTPGIEAGAGLPLVPLLRTAGLLASRQRSAAGLECFIAAHFPGVTVRVESCVERWARIPEDQLMRLGRKRSRLGDDACIGRRVHDRSSAFRIVLGPLAIEQFRSFLPDRESFPRLVRLARLYVMDPLDFDVVLRLEPGDVPFLKLAPRAATADGLPLGQLSWVRPHRADEGRAIIPIRACDPLLSRPAAAPLPSPAAAATPSPGAAAPAKPPAVQPRAPASPQRVQSRPVTTIPTTRRP